MANIRVKDLDSKASFASDDEILMDSPSGTGTMLRDAFIAAVASQIVAAPSTYKIATLDGANKLTSSQDPSQSVSYLGGHDMVANSPALADGSGTAGDTYYVTNPGTRNYGSGNITAQEGDALVYSGSVWQLVEGIANILDGISTASTARTTLEVNSKDEDAQANALKTTAPAMYFNGSSSFVEVADDDKFSFTDGTDDLPFSVSAWVKMDDATDFSIVNKFGSATATREWYFAAYDDYLELLFRDASGNDVAKRSASTVTSYEGSWAHFAATYGGSGPNSTTSFASAMNDEVTLYINGVAVSATNGGSTYGGMANTTQSLKIGFMDYGGNKYAQGHIRDVKIFNRELTASEVAELARGNDLGFADEFGGPLGGTYTSNFTGSTNGWTAVNGNIAHSTSVGGESNALRLILDGTTGGHYLQKTGVFTRGKRYRVKGRYYVPTNSHVDGIFFAIGTTGPVEVVRESATLDSWIDFSVEVVANANADTDRLLVYALDGNSATVTDPGANDVLYILDLVITQIGTLADFRAEDYNESASKLLDRSSNNFVGVGTSVTLTGNQRHISADTIDLKNLPTSSAGLSAGEVWSNGGVLTVV